MNAYIETLDNGLRHLIASPGFSIVLNDDLVSSAFIPKHKSLEDFVVIKNSDYVPPQVDEGVKPPSTTEVMDNQIELSKIHLATYLKENPMFSTVKYEEGRYYTVTLERQQKLVSTLFMYLLYKMEEDMSYPIYWNSTGDLEELWTYSELLKLHKEIQEYIRPLIHAQQELEIQIRECNSSEEVLALNINPYMEVALYHATNTFN